MPLCRIQSPGSDFVRATEQTRGLWGPRDEANLTDATFVSKGDLVSRIRDHRLLRPTDILHRLVFMVDFGYSKIIFLRSVLFT